MTRPGTTPPETFRIRPRPSSRLFVLVHVAETLAAMRQAMLDHTGYCHPKTLACIVACSDASEDRKNAGLVALAFFAKEKLGVGLVGHEMTHAGFRVAERYGWRVEHGPLYGETPVRWKDFSTEERFCHVVEHLTIDFWRKAERHGCIED